ncbi:MAG: glycosyltransferase family 2 protein [Candidatus Omnitrophota bacterium]
MKTIMTDKRKQVKFTVIIPTRERCDVLHSSLKTCTTQEYDNLEIIVSDNFSQDKTKEVVESFKDNRIKYINTGKRVSMTNNWEFALSHVNDGYVAYLGDDDGLLPGALSEVNEIINKTGCEAVSCKPAVYFWPNWYINESKKNILIIPLRTSLVKRISKEMLIDVINFKRDPCELPLLYRGFVSYNAIKRVMRESGRFFHSIIPDIYSGIALACVLESYYYSFKPYAISGTSRHSIGGTADSHNGEDNKVVKKFFSENNLPFHSKLALAKTTSIIVAESFLQAQDHISCAKHFRIDMKKCIKMAIKEAVYFPEEKYSLVVETVNKIARLNRINNYTPKLIAENKNKPTRFHYPVLGFNIARGQVVVNCVEFGAQNIYEAAVLCKHILIIRKLNYFSLIRIIKTTLSLIKREILNKIQY